jgi:hypothetical protein
LDREAAKYRNDKHFRDSKRKLEANRYRSTALKKAEALLRGQRKRLTHPNQQPAWANEKKMLAFYLKAARRTATTGIPHVVDHIIPLRGRIEGDHVVCGLHTHTNLRVVTASTNRKKSYIKWPNMP